jgi:hypothetical protein
MRSASARAKCGHVRDRRDIHPGRLHGIRLTVNTLQAANHGKKVPQVMMRTLCILFCSILLLSGAGAAPHSPGERASRPLVLVELFTSEGCSSCPPADILLAELQASQPVDGATIVPMAFHVDYWDRLGWKDPFADAAYSHRQRSYAAKWKSDRVYTPQMVVNGQIEFVGSDRKAAINAIKRASQSPVAELDLAKTEWGEDTVTLDLRIARMDVKNAVLWAAVVEDGLESSVTRGENQGRRLKHQAVVRVLREETYAPPARDQDYVKVSLPWNAAWKLGQSRIVVAIQDTTTGFIHALGHFPLNQ